MCGRYRLKDPKEAFDFFKVQPFAEVRSRYNIAPTQKIPVVTGAGEIEKMVWGIAPRWATGKSKTSPMHRQKP